MQRENRVNLAFKRFVALVAIGVTATIGATPPALASERQVITTPPTPAQEDQIKRGEIIVHVINRHPIYHLDVYGVIEAPFDRVWGAVTDYARYKEFLPLVVESGIRKRAADGVHQYVRMRPPWPLHDHWMVNINVENRKQGTIAWTMEDGNLRFERGYWQVTPLGPDRTKLQYHLTVDPWLDVVPAWLVDFATRTVLPGVIKGVRKRVKGDVRG